MKFACLSAPKENLDEQEKNNDDEFKLTYWYNSLRRRLLKRNQKEPKVVISEPVRNIDNPAELAQINRVAEVNPIGTICDVTDHQEDVNKDANNVQDNSNELKDKIVENNSSSESKLKANDSVSNDCVGGIEPEPGPADQSEDADDMLSYAWYWGCISRREAEELLRGKKDGFFLVRVSSDPDRFMYSLSFRSYGKTMHTRIEHFEGRYQFHSNEGRNGRTAANSDGTTTLGALIAAAMSVDNVDNIFFYSRGQRSESSLHTVSLNQPLSRYRYLLDYQYKHDEPKALQYMCKFVLAHTVHGRQELPVTVKTFLKDQHYFPRLAPQPPAVSNVLEQQQQHPNLNQVNN